MRSYSDGILKDTTANDAILSMLYDSLIDFFGGQPDNICGTTFNKDPAAINKTLPICSLAIMITSLPG
jgi:hypothetical protein